MTSPTETPHNRILIIDDNPAIHDDIRKILASAEARNASLEQAKAAVLGVARSEAEGMTFVIDSATQGDEGLRMVRQSVEAGQPYALAFVDMRMPPGWDGMTTLAHLWKLDPNLQVVICTAYSDYPWEEIVGKIGKSANMVILKKPFDNIEVLQLSHALTEKWRLNEQVRAKLADLDRLVRQRTSDLEQANEKLRQEIAERALMEEALRQAQKMEAVGQLAAGVAHDFNNILTVILGNVSLLMEATQPEEMRTSAKEIRESAERAASLVRQLLAFSRKQVLMPLPLDLGETITNLGEVLRRVLGEQIDLRVQHSERLPLVKADLRMIEQAVINLAVNARDAMPRGGCLVISASEAEVTPMMAQTNPEVQPGRHVCLSVSDTGVGIAPEILPHVFEPFFTTKEQGKGTGLGLATVYGIVKQHSGWVDVESRVGQGTIFRLFLPAYTSELTVPVAPFEEGAVQGGHETILVVEDETAVRRLAVDVLRRHGYQAYAAGSGDEAVEVFREHADRIQLLLTDLVMPGGLPGRDLVLQLRRQKPNLKIICMTGYSQNLAGAGFEASPEINLLIKPFSGPELLQVVRRTLDQRS
ncbi:MAG: response regulator [Verrucomicrobia bacterium]|nr:response regulator [Verrucomicrobiota bacterium]